MRTFVAIILIFFSYGVLAQDEISKISLEDIYKARKFSTKGAGEIHSMNDGEHFSQIKNDSLNIYDYETGKLFLNVVASNELIPPGDSVPAPMNGYQFSNDENILLFSCHEEAIYRRSFKADYYIYFIKTKKLVPLSGNGKQRLATFSPDGKKIAFVRDNNLFISELDPTSLFESVGKEIQVTFDGKLNAIINGAPDWVYEEEFEFTKGYSWSPDSKKLTYYRFDESNVKEYQLTLYGALYPENEKYKYPMPGEKNAVVSVHIYDIKTKSDRNINIGKDQDVYIPRIKWTPNPDNLVIFRLNRHQNFLDLLLVDANSGDNDVIYHEENKCYIEINDDLTYLDKGNGFLLTSEMDGFNHIYRYDRKGILSKQVTKGEWDVVNIVGVDQINHRIYYLSKEMSPLGVVLYSIDYDGNGKTRLSGESGTTKVEFSKTFKYYLNSWSDINTPPLISINRDGLPIRTIQDNSVLKETMRQYNYRKVSFFTFKTADQIELHGWMLTPPGFDPGKKYPVLFYVYGGPGSQTVIDRWGGSSAWNQLLVQRGIIIVSIDNRGTGGRGEAFKKCTYLQLGNLETIDQIEAVKYLRTLPYIDSGRIGIWGWSYGGFMALNCLTTGADFFKIGIAVAPVTNQKYYDDIYTERYMRTPHENPDGYEKYSPINHVKDLKGKLLLIHGMADDNVHAQNSYDLITALVSANKQFDMQLYPNSNHGIYSGKNTTYHLYNRITDFILNNL